MTFRERVLLAIDHKPTDRIPIDFGGHRSSGISAIAYAKLKKQLGVTTGDIYVYDMIQQLAIVEPPVADALGADVIELGRAFLTREDDWKPWVLPDGTPCKIPVYIHVEKKDDTWRLLAADSTVLAVQPKGCLYFEQKYFPYADREIEKQDFSDLPFAFDHMMWSAIATPGAHLPFTDAGLKQLSAGAKALRASSDKAILGIFGGNLFEVPQFFYRIDNYLTYLGLYPEACMRLSAALCTYYMARLTKWLAAVGDYIDIILFGDDFGGQNGPLISPQMYRDLFKPFHARMWRFVKERAPHLRIQLHSCGGIEPFLNDFIDAGLDMANPVQITCAGMEPAGLKEKYGNRFTFWGGGCNTRDVLPSGTPDEVRANVRSLTGAFAPGGGFVFQQVHNIMADVPPENIIAMFDEARRLKNY
jgi:uroporphyrinogen decarboxylase